MLKNEAVVVEVVDGEIPQIVPIEIRADDLISAFSISWLLLIEVLLAVLHHQFVNLACLGLDV